jgi:hypothetical protein
MAVTVTDRRTKLVEADSISTETWNTGAVTSTAFAEAIGCVADGIGESEGPIYTTNSAINLTNTMVYVYTSVVATQLGWATGAHGLFLGDGTNQINFHQSGNNREVFKHSIGPVGFQCFLLDGSQASAKNTAGETTVIAGSWANFIANIGSITQIGAYFITQSKAIGGGVNCYVDIIRYGNDGLRITAGGSGTEGTFLEIVTEDRSTATLKAHGIIREYTTGMYGCQGALTFGDSGNATNCYFEDDGIVLVYEQRDVGDNKYYFNVEGNSGATNSFVLSDSTISTAGPYVTCNFAAGNVNTLTLNSVVFSNLGNSITFSNSADATGHTVDLCTFSGCGQIDPGDVTFTNNLISGSTASATGALLLDADGASNISGISFVSGGTGHAIYIPNGATGDYTLTNFTYSGYGASATGNAVIYNNSGGEVTIYVSGGESPSYLNGVDASTSIVNSKTLTLTGLMVGSEARIYDANNTELSGIESVTSGVTYATISNGGASYTVDDILTISGGTYSTQAQLKVESVDAGVITEISIETIGDYTVNPSNPVSVTGGTGTGAKFDLTMRGTHAYNYNAAAPFVVRVVVFHIDYKAEEIKNIILSDQDQSLYFQQRFDRTYQA